MRVTERVIDFDERLKLRASQLDEAVFSPRNIRRIPQISYLRVDLAAMATDRQRMSELPAVADGVIRIEVDPDDSWVVKVARSDDLETSLILRGTRDASAPRVLREVLCWLFGVPA